MKRFLSIILSFIISLVPLITFAENEAIADDQCIYDVFLKYADSLSKVSYKEIKDYLDSLGYSYETRIDGKSLTIFRITCKLGSLYICCYPLGDDDSEYGNPEKEMLCCLEYSREDRWISISNDFHMNAGVLKTGDRSREPINQKVFTLRHLIDFYNNEIGGSVTVDPDITITTEVSRESMVRNTVDFRITEYMDTTVDHVDVNSNMGTSDPDDFLILIYLGWGTKNGVERTQTMLEMYSDDMAATLAAIYENASDIVLFWEVPFLLEKGVCAKYSYKVRNGKAYIKEATGPLYK